MSFVYWSGPKNAINFALESEWAHIRVGLYPDGPLFKILRYDGVRMSFLSKIVVLQFQGAPLLLYL